MMKTEQQIRRQAARALSPTTRLGHVTGSILSNGILWIFSFTCIFPIIWMLYSSFKTQTAFNADIIALPTKLYWGNYVDILQNTRLPRYMLNSLVVTFVSLALIVLIGFITGYFLGRFRFWGDKALGIYFLLGMLVPVHALMVPMYVLFKNSHLSNQWFTLVLPYVAFGLPVTVFLVQSYVRSL
ncbi:MAG: carbohydrate ABC transporter permease, partial [Angelakisella sp.]